jgi:AcrR family transcriptional regulator
MHAYLFPQFVNPDQTQARRVLAALMSGWQTSPSLQRSGANIRPVDTRTQMLKAAESLLQKSHDSDISTRAVCEAVGVGPPVLYRLFGDKNGLIAAVVDSVFARYLARKRAEPLSDDPVDDLYSAWDNHVAFAMKNQAVYRMAYAPSLAQVPAGVDEARQVLVERFVRCAAAGRLNTAPDQATQTMMAACVGVNLCLLSQPATYSDPDLSRRVRDAVLGGLVIDTGSRARGPKTKTLKAVALQMAALIRQTPTPLTEPEVTLMLQWLETLTAAASPSAASRSDGRRTRR